MKNSKHLLAHAGLAAVTMVFLAGAIAQDAQAGRVFIGGGVVVGAPVYEYPPYYSYPYYAYPPAAVYAPPAYAVPATVPAAYSYAPPPPAPNDRYYDSPSGQYCREYTHTITVDGQPNQAYGHACRQEDGTWHIID